MNHINGGILDPESVGPMADAIAREWGQRIAKVRKERKFSEATLAHLVGVTETSIRRFEAGRQVPRDRTRWAIAAALVVEVDELFPAPKRSRINTAKVA